MKLTSKAFREHEDIPEKYTSDGDNINPPLEISGVPTGTQSLALIMDDPSSNDEDCVNWLLWNISPDTREIEKNSVPEGAIQGINYNGTVGYFGPAPTAQRHIYRFRLYALDNVLNLENGATKKELKKATAGHIIEKTVLAGFYEKYYPEP
jgi:hypothetical protein